jgi:hypothetical protein
LQPVENRPEWQMGNLSVKNILWVVFSVSAGYFGGAISGAILGTVLWALCTLFLGTFIYHSPNTILINTSLSIILGILLSLPAIAAIRKLFGHSCSYLNWGMISSAIGLVVMFTYGTNIISHPESYANYNQIILTPRGLVTDPNLKLETLSNYSELYFGSGTGQLVGSFLYALLGLVVSARETLLKKRAPEEKQEFEAYSKFFDSYSKK